MSFIIKSIVQRIIPQKPYAILKKDDDVGVDRIRELLERYAVNQEIFTRKNEEIKKYVATLIKDVQSIPVTSSNVDIIAERLREIAKTCNRVYLFIMEELDEAKGIEKELRKHLLTRLIFVCPRIS